MSCLFGKLYIKRVQNKIKSRGCVDRVKGGKATIICKGRHSTSDLRPSSRLSTSSTSHPTWKSELTEPLSSRLSLHPLPSSTTRLYPRHDVVPHPHSLLRPRRNLPRQYDRCKHHRQPSMYPIPTQSLPSSA